MNKQKNSMSVWLGILSLLFLAAAISVLIFQYSMSERSKAALELLYTQDVQGDAEPNDTEQPDTNGSDGASHGEAGFAQETESDISDNEAESPVPPAVPNPYKDDFLANEDMGAWLKIDGTVIDYPVMWTPRDETYYINRNFEGKPDQNGCLLLDTDSCLDPLTTNLIIHGHNMRSGAMFGSLMKYDSKSYCDEHNIITLYTEQAERRYEVIAVFRSQVYRKKDTVFKFYNFFQADTQEEFEDFYQNIKALSLYDTGVTAEFGDHFITLSTCAYHVENGRFVVVGKEIENGGHYLSFR